VLPVWSFLAVTLPLVLTPGASTAVVLRNSISGGTRAGVETAAGVNSGSVAYGVLSAFGLAVALQRWPALWVVLRYAGAAYLTWLALRSLSAAMVPRPQPVAGDVARARRRGALRNVSDGFLTNLLNPAIATFYLVVVPQFVPPGARVARSVLLLMTVHVATALTWHLVWVAAGATLARTLTAGPARRALDGATGVALLVLAGRVLMSSR
jgi:threonine/homoserine/homoserine lactone efflux protein